MFKCKDYEEWCQDNGINSKEFYNEWKANKEQNECNHKPDFNYKSESLDMETCLHYGNHGLTIKCKHCECEGITINNVGDFWWNGEEFV